MRVSSQLQDPPSFASGDGTLLIRLGRAIRHSLARDFGGLLASRDELEELGRRIENAPESGPLEAFRSEDVQLLGRTERSLRLLEPLAEQALPFDRPNYEFRRWAADAASRCTAVIIARLGSPTAAETS